MTKMTKQNGRVDYGAMRQALIDERDELVRRANERIIYLNGQIELLQQLENPVQADMLEAEPLPEKES